MAFSGDPDVLDKKCETDFFECRLFAVAKAAGDQPGLQSGLGDHREALIHQVLEEDVPVVAAPILTSRHQSQGGLSFENRAAGVLLGDRDLEAGQATFTKTADAVPGKCHRNHPAVRHLERSADIGGAQ